MGENKKSGTYYPYLDGLRCIAVCWVILYHLKFKASGALGLIFNRGWMGVDMFFVISGFLITTILLREYHETGEISLRRFYIRRALRLWPAYYTLIALTVLYGALHWDETESALIDHTIQWPSLYLENVYYAFGPRHSALLHSWSLCLEEQFYLLWSLILVLSVRRAKWIAVFGIVVVTAWRSWLTFHLPIGLATVSRTYGAPDTRMDVILCGCVLAFILTEPAQRDRLTQELSRWWLPILLIATFGGSLYVNNRWSGHLGNSVGYTLSAITMASVLAYLHTQHPRWPMAILECRPVVYVGKISYGIYLFHPAVVDIAEKLTANWIELVCFSYGGTILVASISYKIIEAPFLRMKRNFSATPRATLTPQSI